MAWLIFLKCFTTSPWYGWWSIWVVFQASDLLPHVYGEVCRRERERVPKPNLRKSCSATLDMVLLLYVKICCHCWFSIDSNKIILSTSSDTIKDHKLRVESKFHAQVLFDKHGLNGSLINYSPLNKIYIYK